MGYYTHYTARVTGPTYAMARLLADSEETFGEYGIEIEQLLDGELFGGESVKWYDCRKDMLEVSERYPSILFQIDGRGEESGDVWRAYYRNGKEVYQKAVFEFPEVDLDVQLPYNEDAERELRAVELKQQIAHLEDEADRLKTALASL